MRKRRNLRIIKWEGDLLKVKPYDEVLIENLNLGLVSFPQNVVVVLKGNSKIEVKQEVFLVLHNESKAIIRNGGHARLYEDSSAEFYDNSKGNLYDNSSGKFFDFSVGYLWSTTKSFWQEKIEEIPFGYFYDNSRGHLTGRAAGFFTDYSQAYMIDRARGTFFRHALGKIADAGAGEFHETSIGILAFKASGTFYDSSICIKEDSYMDNIKLYGNSKFFSVLYKFSSKKEWLRWSGAEVEGDYVYLYKWVREDFKDFYGGTIDYSQEEIEAPDWDPLFNDECGKGLHLAVDPWTAFTFKPFAKGRMLKFKVPINDFVVLLNKPLIFPAKVRVKKLSKYIEELHLKNGRWV